VYIKGEDNTVADALSQVPTNAYPNERECPPHVMWMQPVNVVLSIATDTMVLEEIKAGYLSDTFCKKLESGSSAIPGTKRSNGLWYMGNHLVIP
jgi:hypothetical protein